MILILMFLGSSNSMWKPWELRQELETSLIMRRIKSAQNHQEHIISSPGYYTSLITILRVHFHRWNKFCSNHFSKLFHIVDEGYMTVIVIWNGTQDVFWCIIITTKDLGSFSLAGNRVITILSWNIKHIKQPNDGNLEQVHKKKYDRNNNNQPIQKTFTRNLKIKMQ